MIKSIMPSNSISFIPLLYRLAIYELGDVDELIDWTESAKIKRQLSGEYQIGVDDRSVMELTESIEAVEKLHSDLVIIALWRCVELCRKRVIEHTLGSILAKSAYINKSFIKSLEKISIIESDLVAYQSINELRCLNNSIKHNGTVGKELAYFPRWQAHEGEELPILTHLYKDFRSDVELYVLDLVSKADVWWRSNQ